MCLYSLVTFRDADFYNHSVSLNLEKFPDLEKALLPGTSSAASKEGSNPPSTLTTPWLV